MSATRLPGSAWTSHRGIPSKRRASFDTAATSSCSIMAWMSCTRSQLIFSPATQESSAVTSGSVPATSGNPQACDFIPPDSKSTKGVLKAPGIQASVDISQALLKFEHAILINDENATSSASIHAATTVRRQSKRVPGTICSKENGFKSTKSSSRSWPQRCQAKGTSNSHGAALSPQPKHCRPTPRFEQNLHSHMTHLQLPKIPSRKPELLL